MYFFYLAQEVSSQNTFQKNLFQFNKIHVSNKNNRFGLLDSITKTQDSDILDDDNVQNFAFNS